MDHIQTIIDAILEIMDGSEEFAAMNAELTTIEYDECHILAMKRHWKSLNNVPFVIKHAAAYYDRTRDVNVAAHIHTVCDEVAAMKRRLQE